MIRAIVIISVLLAFVGSARSADLSFSSSEIIGRKPTGLRPASHKAVQRTSAEDISRRKVRRPQNAGKSLPLAQSTTPQCPIAARYAVEGVQPGTARPYRGEAIILASGTGCRMKWLPPNDSEGTGDYKNG